ncbi:MAG: hypothetical protein C5B52_15765 [Bacteroidetes bacterium]|nr:MAG: hypothetical protein C5B52_15765 [Bacteroidota bacterium]
MIARENPYMKTNNRLMKKFICIGIIALIVSGGSLFAQNFSIVAGDIPDILCRKWEINYAEMGGKKIQRIVGAEMDYQFNKNKTFTISNDDPKETKRGTWYYDSNKKLIRLIINGRIEASIVSLKDGEFVMVDDNDGSAEDPMEIRLYYKPKA